MINYIDEFKNSDIVTVIMMDNGEIVFTRNERGFWCEDEIIGNDNMFSDEELFISLLLIWEDIFVIEPNSERL